MVRAGLEGCKTVMPPWAIAMSGERCSITDTLMQRRYRITKQIERLQEDVMKANDRNGRLPIQGNA